MSALVYRAAGAASQSASATTLTPAKPTPLGVHPDRGFMIAVCCVKSNAVITTATSGWTKLFQTNSGASFTKAVFIAREAAAAPVFTWTGAAACFAITHAWSTGANPISVPTIGNTSSATGTVSPHTSPSLLTTRQFSTVIYIDAVSQQTTALAEPAGWTEHADTGFTTAVGRITVGSKYVPTLGDSSGAISVTGGAAAWVQSQIEIIIELPATGQQYVEAELDVIYSPFNGLSTAETELAIVYSPAPAPGLGVAEVELAVVFSPAAPVVAANRRRPLYLN